MKNLEHNTLAHRYDTMYKERAKTNPLALTLDFWKNHFVTELVCSANDIYGNVLDIGCGTGEIDIWLARTKNNVKITAVDVCPEAIKIAKDYVSKESEDVKSRLLFVESMIEKLPLNNEMYDTCIISHVLEHIEDHLPIFNELYRVMKNEAQIIIVVPFDHCHDDKTHVWHFLESQLKAHLEMFGARVIVWRSQDGQQLAAKMKLLKKPKIVCTLRVKNEEDWIMATLEKASPLVAGFIILDDGSTDRTQELCKSFPQVLRYVYQNEPVKDEARDKDKLLNLALDEDPDWILALDGDELLEDAAPLIILREIAACPKQVTALGFNFLYMWNDHGKYRVDGKYQKLSHPRLFKVKGLGIDPRKLRYKTTDHGANFHCGSIPANLPGEIRFIDVNIKHYGYFYKEQRERKRAFYALLDPHSAAKGYYNHLTDEAGLILLPWCERSLEEVKFSSTNSAVKTVDLGCQVKSLIDLPQYYRHVRPEILSAVPMCALNILDVGCGAGVLGKALKEQNNARKVVGIEGNYDAHFVAKQNIDLVYHAEIETFVPPFAQGQFDCLIFADILEHLKDPWNITKQYITFLKPGGTVIVSIPNIRRLSILKDLAVDGLWQYQDEGILDRTHLRFFTRKQFLELLREASVFPHTTEFLRGDSLAHLKPGADGIVRYGNLVILNVDAQEFAELCALQIMFVGTYHPDKSELPFLPIKSKNEYKVTIIIPVYNKVEYTQKCIHAIIRNTTITSYEVVVVDNGSSDGTTEYLRGLSGDIKVITNVKNVGYTIACNQGAAVACGKYLVFLNNDTLPQPGWLQALVATADRDSSIGAVGGKLVYPDGKLQEAGAIVFNDGSALNFGRGNDPNKSFFNQECEVDYCSGACLLIPSQIFKELGGFDERYAPAYYEETDFCFTLREHGYKVIYQPQAEIVHYGSVTAGLDPDGPQRKYLTINKSKFVQKWGHRLASHGPAPSAGDKQPASADRTRLDSPLNRSITVASPSAHLTIGLHAQTLERADGVIAGSEITTAGLMKAFLARPEVHAVKRYGPENYSTLTSDPLDILIFEGWDPMIPEIIRYVRKNRPSCKVFFWNLSFLGLEEVQQLDVDAYFTNSKRNLSLLSQRKPTYFLMLAADTDEFKPTAIIPEYRHDVVYLGMFHPHKSIDVMERILGEASGFDLAIYGNRWDEHPDFGRYWKGRLPKGDITRLYSSAKVVLGTTEDRQRAAGMINNRVFEALACGSCFISEHFPELENEFGDAILYSRNPGDTACHIRTMLEQPEKRRQMGISGRELLLARHTYAHRVSEIMAAYQQLSIAG